MYLYIYNIFNFFKYIFLKKNIFKYNYETEIDIINDDISELKKKYKKYKNELLIINKELNNFKYNILLDINYIKKDYLKNNKEYIEYNKYNIDRLSINDRLTIIEKNLNIL